MRHGRRIGTGEGSPFCKADDYFKLLGMVFFKRCTIVAAIVLGAVCVGLSPVEAASTVSVDTFVSQYNGRKVDFDGVYGAQCVDLVAFYNRDVVGGSRFGGNAYQLFDNAPASYYVKLSASSTPQKGDIAVWGSSLPNSGGNGHVAIVLGAAGASKLNVFQQNAPQGSAASIGTFGTAYLRGYLRPRGVSSESGQRLVFSRPDGTFVRASDGGPWQRLQDSTVLDLSASGSRTAIVNSVGGYFRTSDSAGWTLVSGNISKLAIDENGRLAFARPDGTFVRATDGAPWQKIYAGAATDIDVAGTRTAIVNSEGGFYRVADDQPWVKVSANIKKIAIDANGRLAFTRPDGTFVRAYDGGPWMRLQDNAAMDISVSGPRTAIVNSDGGYFRTSDTAAWTKVSGSITQLAVG